jgi:maleylpyruvate isomerase
VTDPTASAGPAGLPELVEAQRRLLRDVADLDDDACRAPSRLPGWSRGHVLTHIARNAGGMGRLVRWASTGEVTPMYASADARAADIEAGSGRPAAELRRDVAESGDRLVEALATLAGPALAAVVEMGATRRPTRGDALVGLRIREVVIHHVDLATGFTPADWSADFTGRTLGELIPLLVGRGTMPVGRLRATDSGQVWETPGAPGELSGPATALLGWLLGRIPVDDAAAAGLELAGGGDVPSAPPWS